MKQNLKYKSVFDIIGPVMIGPSSSHTAGAVRIGRIVRTIFGDQPTQVEFHLYESFAKTYQGHGTDVALVAGVLGMDTDDADIPSALEIAHEKGIEVLWNIHKEDKAAHPNTAKIDIKNADKHMTITGISIGGGAIQVTELNGFDVALSMSTPTFVIVHQDVPGMIAEVTRILSKHGINIGKMSVTRESQGEKAIMMIEVDTHDVSNACEEIRDIPNLHNVNFFG
jgi:L-serine dehydratase